MQGHPVPRRALRVSGLMPLLAALAVGSSGPLAAQSSTRPQLQILQVETDPGLETLFIQGRHFVWANDLEPSVTLAGYPLTVLNVTETQIQALVPEGLPAGSYLLGVSRGPGGVQNGVFVVTLGAVGPGGPPGTPGDPGAPGEPGNIGVAGQVCPAGTFVTGFNISGQILCGIWDDTASPAPPDWTPITLPHGSLAQDFLNGLIGNEANGLYPFSFPVPLIGTASGAAEILGFAFCEPADPTALPAATPPLFGCSANVVVTLVAGSPDQATLTIRADRLFVRVGGTWQLSSLSGEIDGFGLLGDVRIQVSLPLIDAEEGLKRFGTPTLVNVNFGSSQMNVDFGNALLNSIASMASFMANHLFTQFRGEIGRLAIEAAGTLVELVPPFELQP